MASPTAAQSGLDSRVNAAPFVPSAPPGLGANATTVAAKPFVTGSSSGGTTALNAKPFVPASSAAGGNGTASSSSGGGSLSKSASSSSLTSGAVHAPIFVPGGGGGGGKLPGVDAKPFVPSGSTQPSQRHAAGGVAAAGPGGTKPPRPSPSKVAGRSVGGGGGGRGQQQQPGRGSTPDLPEGDDVLGITAVTPGDARDVAAQAAEMFKNLNPFPPPSQQQQQHQQPPAASPQLQSVGGGGGGTGARSRGGSAGSQRSSPRPASAQGLGPPPPGFAPTTAAASTAAAAAAILGAPSSSSSIASSAPGPGSTSSTGGGGNSAWSATSQAAGPSGTGGRGSGTGGGPGRGRGRGRRPGSSRPSAAYSTAPGRMQKAGMFISEQLRQELQQRSYLAQAQVNPETEGDLGVPQMVQAYHTLYPLEDLSASEGASSQALGVGTQVAKAINSMDGQAYVLRRVDGRQVIPTAELLGAAEACVARWEPVANHPHLVGLWEAFVSSDWPDGSPSLFFVHDYHPGAFTLEQAHMLPAQTSQGLVRNPASEDQLWSYLVQLTSALRCIHQAGLAARPPCLMPSKVLVTSSGRVRIGSLGVPEALSEAAGYQDVAQLQREDLAALGNMLLLLACVGRGAAPSLDYLAAHFSREFCHVVAGLLAAAEGSGFASWRSLLSALGDRVADELDSATLYSDALVGEVQREADNGRLLRLLMKLCYVTERPELGGDAQWAETGDRYLLKLFRDFLFHQVDDEGAPLLDWGLVAEALNKVDAGAPEKVLLMSRDEVSMLVVSYADIRRCIASCYEELRTRASTQYPQPPQLPGGSGGGGGGPGLHRSRSRHSMQAMY